MLQGRQPELIADGEGNEAQRHIADQAEAGNIIERGKADPGNAQKSQTVGPNEDACYQVSGDGGQMPALDEPGHHQAG